MPHETRVRDDQARETLDDLYIHFTTAETDVELAEAIEKTDQQYGTAVNAADVIEEHNSGGWAKVSVYGWCNDGAGNNRNNALFLIEVSHDNVHWHPYYQSPAVEIGPQRWEFECPEPYVRVTAGDLLGGGTGVAGDLIDLAISSTN